MPDADTLKKKLEKAIHRPTPAEHMELTAWKSFGGGYVEHGNPWHGAMPGVTWGGPSASQYYCAANLVSNKSV